MTVQEMGQARWIIAELERDEAERERLMQCAQGRAMQYDGVRVQGGAPGSGLTASLAIRLADVERNIEKNKERLQAILDAITGEPDAMTRNILKLKYLDGLNYTAISRQLHCSRKTIFVKLKKSRER